jgi:DNA-directed RNA polymerase specialized sigma24 family protein
MSYDWSREIPVEVPSWWVSRTQPQNEYEALMRCAPGEEPRASVTERLAAKEATATAFQCLTPEELWVVNATVIERMSLRQLARQIGATKTTIARIRDRGLQKLRKELEDNPDIQSVLKEMGFGQAPR